MVVKGTIGRAVRTWALPIHTVHWPRSRLSGGLRVACLQGTRAPVRPVDLDPARMGLYVHLSR